MSGSVYSLELSEEAYDDLVNIQAHTYREFGESQWEKYGSDLDNGMNHILNHPLTGHKRGDIPKEYLSWTVREHIMVYRIERKIIYLVRVLHKRMDFRFQFDG